MTPYATLIVRPADADEVIRARFHQLARRCHPDAVLTRRGTNFLKLTEDWVRYSGAYGLIKTAALRQEWERRESIRAERCKQCAGNGVTGGPLSGVKVCERCKGEGRT